MMLLLNALNLFKLKSLLFYFNSQRYEKTIQNCDWTLGNFLQNIVWHAFPWTQGWSWPICLPKSYIADTWFVVFPAFVQTNMYLMWCCDQGVCSWRNFAIWWQKKKRLPILQQIVLQKTAQSRHISRRNNLRLWDLDHGVQDVSRNTI